MTARGTGFRRPPVDATLSGMNACITRCSSLLVLALLTACTLPDRGAPRDAPAASSTRRSFDDLAVGSLPAGWRSEGTNRNGTAPADWAVVQDSTAPSGDRVLALRDARGAEGDVFNMLWTDAVRLRDGFVEAHVKAVDGVEDQGGGVVWRVQDANNYYVARWNPLEDNFRVYYVEDGERHQLDSFRTRGNPESWHVVRAEMVGDKITCYLDGEALLEVRDGRFPEAGGVGVWAKADALTWFDDFVAGPLNP